MGFHPPSNSKRHKKKRRKESKEKRDGSEYSTYNSSETSLKGNEAEETLKPMNKSDKPHINVIKEVYERRKLKDKSLSKKVRPTFEKKATRSCLPIRIRKCCRIKKKPKEKQKEMPTHKSLKRRKFSSPKLFFNNSRSPKTRPKPAVSDSDPELHSPDDEVEDFLEELEKESYTPVTPEILVQILNYPILFKFGATLSMIVKKLRALKESEFNPNMKFLREEVKKKLICAEKLGMVTHQNGHYWLTDDFRVGKLSRKEVNAFWEYYCTSLMTENCAKAKYMPRSFRI